MSGTRGGLRQLEAIVQELKGFDPERGHGEPLRFTNLEKGYPSRLRPKSPSLPPVGMANFAGIADCGYKPWHRTVGTEERRTAAGQRALDRGTHLHERKVAFEVKEAAKLPVATPRDLRNLRVDVYRLPEVRARIRVGRLLYDSSIERAGRQAGDLVVTEIKTGNYVFAPDHLLQVWGYCASAPGALLHWTRGHFRARSVRWALEYPTRGITYGPYPFTEEALRLLRWAMSLHEQVYLMGRLDSQEPGHDLYGPSERKCPPCAFFHACGWRYREPDQATLAVASEGASLKSVEAGKAAALPPDRLTSPAEALSATPPAPSNTSAPARHPGPSPAARPRQVET